MFRLLLFQLLLCPTVVHGATVRLKPCLSVGSSSSGLGSASGSQSGESETAGGTRRASPQAFELPELILSWDGWQTSQLVTTVAAIILKEKLGFNVKFKSGISPKQSYAALSKGELHMVFEAWTASNAASFKEFKVGTANSTIHYFPYTLMFGRSGVYETCDRQKSTTSGYAACSGTVATEPYLQDALKTTAGQQRFGTVRQLFGEWHPTVAEWAPSICKTQTCSTEVMHISASGYDEGLVEALVEKLKIPAKVLYLGAANHTKALWKAFVTATPILAYSYAPNTNLLGISLSQLPRAQLDPDLDLPAQRLAKLAWKGLSGVRGGLGFRV
jgi:hypothetical protein